MGLNGAGKSTLLKLISGVMKPTEGVLKIKGRISPLLELGAGFDHNYTGRENIFLNGALLGYSKSFLETKFDEIVEFSELSDFIDVPLKNYSSGMIMRLGFSIATVVEPEILILDEVLSVGDAKFQEKCEKKMQSFMDKDVTVLFVSHTIQQVRDLCNKAIWLDKGKLIMQGNVDEVCDEYYKSIYSENSNDKSNRIQSAMMNSQDLQVKNGEILGLLGVKNIDKNDTLKSILGFLKSNNIRMSINDEEMRNLNKKYIGVCPHELGLWEDLTCRENLNLIGRMYKVPKNSLKNRVDRLLFDLFLMDHADIIASKLSGGMQRCLNLALALVHEPEIVLIDKPSDGLDQQSRLIIWNYIRSLRDLDEKTVILLTQNVNEAESLSDRVAIIDGGQIIKLDTPFNLKKDMGKGDLVEISLSNSNKNREVIKNLNTIQDIIWVDDVDGYIHLSILNAKSKLPLVMMKIKELNVQVKDFSVHHNTLEDVFIELTGTSLGDSK